MTRADVRTFAWLLPLALLLAISWRLWGTYVAYEIAAIWADKFPVEEIQAREIPAMSISPEGVAAADTVQVENPYALPYGPSGLETGLRIVIPLGIVLLVSFLSARNFQHHAAIRAAALMFIALLISRVFVWLEFLNRNLRYFGEYTATDWILDIAAFSIGAVVGGALAWLAATLMIRWRARG